MFSKLLVSVILPASDEVGRIGHSITEAKAYFERRGTPYEIIVAADGNDGTRELVEDTFYRIMWCGASPLIESLPR
jgi:glycosyltransferase involved in cell wall biosynthesis